MRKLEDNAWTTLQEADVEKHIMAIVARTENGKVVEMRIRHSRGEETPAKITYNGKPALPMDIDEFVVHYDKKDFEIK